MLRNYMATCYSYSKVLYLPIYIFDRDIVCPNRVAVRILVRSRSQTDIWSEINDFILTLPVFISNLFGS